MDDSPAREPRLDGFHGGLRLGHRCYPLAHQRFTSLPFLGQLLPFIVDEANRDPSRGLLEHQDAPKRRFPQHSGLTNGPGSLIFRDPKPGVDLRDPPSNRNLAYDTGGR